MTGYIVAGKNNGGYKYGGIAKKPPKVCLVSICLMLTTSIRLIMTGYIVAGKNNGGYKYGGIAEKLPNLTRHN